MFRVLTLATIAFALLRPQQPPSEAPHTFQLDGALLAHVRSEHNPIILQRAVHDADAAMHVGPFSVMEKSTTPPSGNKHNYLSLAPYFWPNPSTPDHLPYVRHDGERNPEINKIPDHTDIFDMEKAVHALALGYEFTGREEYASRATLLIRAWFLDPETQMLPTMEYAQGVRGKSTGRPEGVLEARGLPEVADAIAMLQGSPSWTAADQKGIQAWFAQYYHWLRTGDLAQGEQNARNNHGSWYDAQAVGIALFLGKTEDARAILNDAKQRRIAAQIQPDGREPLELARTKSFSYSIFDLDALIQLADYGDRIGVDLWHYRAPNGASIQTALEYLLPFALGEKKWPYKNINGFEGKELAVPLLQAAVHLHNPKYLAASQHLGEPDSMEALLLNASSR
jgi:hypothetical protein